MPSTALAFASRAAHRAWLETQALLPEGFRAGTATFEFTPVEAPRPGRMNLALLALERPTASFALQFTRNAFPGAPVLVGRRRLGGARLGAVLVNNKISNVGAPGGVEAAERICAEVARQLGLGAEEVLPASTGVIGWRLPVERMAEALPRAVAGLQARSALPAAEAIMTTDLYPKVRRAEVGAGSLVGIAFGKSLLARVDQYGKDGTAVLATHTFNYYDDLHTSGSTYQGFDASQLQAWNTQNDNVTTGVDLGGFGDGKASALGGEKSSGADGRLYLGFNLYDGQKEGSIGVGLTFAGEDDFAVLQESGAHDANHFGGVVIRLSHCRSPSP